MKTILITGGAGFIGGNFTRHLHRKYPDYRIIVLDALTYAGNIRNLPEDAMESRHIEFQYGNVCNGPLVESLMSRCDYVVHFAAESHVTRSIYDNFQFFETDVIGTQVVSNAVTKFRDRIKLFIHISTSEVYGTALADKMNEDHPLNPMSPYAAAKTGADRLVYSYWATYNLPTTIVRPFNNYGPYQHLEKLIPRFVTSCLTNEPLRVHGDGLASRDFVHVQDTCHALDLIMHAPGEKVIGQIFNIGTGQSLSISEIGNQVRKQMKAEEVPMVPVSDRPGQVFRHTCDYSRLKATLGWQPTISFTQGLQETIEWYRENPDWWKPQRWMREIPIVTANGQRTMH